MKRPFMSVGTLEVDNIVGAGMLPYCNGRKIFLDPNHGSDGNTGLSPKKAKASLAAAYALCRESETAHGWNDTVYFMQGNHSNVLTEPMDWAKSHTHLIGIGGMQINNSRCRISYSNVVRENAMFTVSGNGCIFTNIYWQDDSNASTTSTAPGALLVTGDRNYFGRCHIAGMMHSTLDVASAYALRLNGCTEMMFEDCHIGNDTIDKGSAANSTILWSDGSKVYFKGGVIYARIESATNHYLVKITADGQEANGGALAHNIFENVSFIYTSTNQAYTPTGYFSIAAQAGATKNLILLKNCVGVSGVIGQACDWDASDRGLVWADMTATASNGDGGYSIAV